MNIVPSASIRQDYNRIARLCRETGEPVYLTKKGAGDLVVMSMEAFERRERMLDLRERLLLTAEGRSGAAGDPTLCDTMEAARRAILAEGAPEWTGEG